MNDNPHPHRRVLVVGATGTTGGRVVQKLTHEGHTVRPAARSTSPAFDWADPATHTAPLDRIDAVYLVPPPAVADPQPIMGPFVERALRSGVRRFVLLSASMIPEGAAGVGRVHALLRERVPEWAVLRPTWFMQNFERGHYMAEDARAGHLATSTQDARIPFIDADDIAAVAVRALVDPGPHQTDHVLTGPEALSYDDVAAVLSQVSGRRVVHERVDRDAVRDRMLTSGVPAVFAELLADLENGVRAGAEDRTTDAVHRITGRPPRSFAAWAQAHAAAWAEGTDPAPGTSSAEDSSA